MKRVFLQNHESIDFIFKQNKYDFLVDEIFQKPFKQKGTFLILQIQKINITTWEAIDKIASFLNISSSYIGYAGLKDKYATTTQYFSLAQKYEKQLEKFYHKQIEIIAKFKDSTKINIGDLIANRFTIMLHNVDNIKAGKIQKISKNLEQVGFANYFGYQRFGTNSVSQAKEMIDGELFIKDKRIKKFLISVYQSYKFNEWLNKRVQISKNEDSKIFKLLNGDVMIDNKEKLFTPKIPLLKDFLNKKITPTGLLVGRHVFRAKDEARSIEKIYDDELFTEKGLRRRAWIYPTKLTCKYIQDDKAIRLSFTLPKASYATVFIENIANKNFS